MIADALDYRAQSPAVSQRFQKLKERPVVLEVRDLSKTFAGGAGPTLALDRISFTTHRREFLCVIGPSGCGKSTLARLIAGLEPCSGGRILLDGKPVEGPGSDRGMVFQGYTLFPWLTVLKNVMFGLEVSQGLEARSAEQEARQWLELVGLAKFAQSYPHQLSGGMKQRVAIARALANRPRILLMDEPFGALDVQTKSIMQGELLQLWEQLRPSVLFITHDLDEAVALSDRVAVMTSSPGSIKKVFDIDLPRPRGNVQDLRHDRRFLELQGEIWESLRDEVTRAYERTVAA